MHIRWRGFELPSIVNVDAVSLTGTYGKFIAEPFERGFGTTIGNSLRRVLLSSLEGSSVTQIKVRGAQHEFTTIPGVLEDITDIVLNVKSLVVKNHSEATRVGQKTNYDKLTLEIWTNGSIHPEMALVESAKILRKHLNPFVQYAEMGPKVHAPVRGTNMGIDGALDVKLNMSLAELKLSVRAMNCLESESIHTVRDLVQKTEDQLLEVRNFGDTTLNEVRDKLHELGLYLGMRVPGVTLAR